MLKTPIFLPKFCQNADPCFEAGIKLAEDNPVTLWLAEAGVVPSDSEQYETSQVGGYFAENVGK